MKFKSELQAAKAAQKESSSDFKDIRETTEARNHEVQWDVPRLDSILGTI